MSMSWQLIEWQTGMVRRVASTAPPRRRSVEHLRGMRNGKSRALLKTFIACLLIACYATTVCPQALAA